MKINENNWLELTIPYLKETLDTYEYYQTIAKNSNTETFEMNQKIQTLKNLIKYLNKTN